MVKTSPSGAGGTGSIPGQEDPTYLLTKRPKHNHNCNKINKKALKEREGASLVVQCQRLSTYNGGSPGFNPWVGKIPWRRK